MLATLAITNYRSLRDLTVPLHQLNIITGANGSGKSSVYRALRLLAETAQGGVIPSLAREGGLQSTLWAGPESFSRAIRAGEQAVQGVPRKHPVNLKLGFAGVDFGYAIDLGLPVPGVSDLSLDPVIKRECIWSGPVLRPTATLVERRGAVVSCRRDDGEWDVIASHVPGFDSMMIHVANPRNAPEVASLRERICGWRFYNHFRIDSGAPARLPQVGTHTPCSATMAQTWRQQYKPYARSAMPPRSTVPSPVRKSGPGAMSTAASNSRCFSTACCGR